MGNICSGKKEESPKDNATIEDVVEVLPSTPKPFSQERLEGIVQAAGRRMVAVRSTNHAYYDQGFGAALAQHLETSCQFEPLPAKLPGAVAGSRLRQVLAEGSVDVSYLDQVADSVLEELRTDGLFRQAAPIVESLI